MRCATMPTSLPHSAPCPLALPQLLLMLLLLLILPAPSLSMALRTRAAITSGAYDCDAYVPAFDEENIAADANCLALLRQPSSAARFEACRDTNTNTNTTCYLFLQEAPFIIFDPAVFNNSAAALDALQRPFPCGDPSSLHPSLSGIAFSLHALTSSADALCVWAGPIATCAFNAVVDFTHAMAADGYRFGITGLLLETPHRQCNHAPSAPLIDNAMTIVGRNTAVAAKGPFFQLIRPFRWSTWGIFAAVILAFIFVCFAIALRFRVFRSHSLLTAFFIFVGDRDQALAHELVHDPPPGAAAVVPAYTDYVVSNNNNDNDDDYDDSTSSVSRDQNRFSAARPLSCHTPMANTRCTTVPPSRRGLRHWRSRRRRSYLRRPGQRAEADGVTHAQDEADAADKAARKHMPFTTKYGLAMTLFRLAVGSFLAVFALFYEVAVVNFLFQQQTLELGKTVTSLSNAELKGYSVLKNSALESVWNVTVNPEGRKFDGNDPSKIPWQRCESGTQCIEWTLDDDGVSLFDVTFEIVGKYLISQMSSCDELTMFETKDILYQFNAGWLYNSAVNVEVRKQVDRELVGLRIGGTIREIVDEEVGDFSCTESPKPDIGPLIILVPVGLFVLPPLVCAIAVLFCWGRPGAKGRIAPVDGAPTARKEDMELDSRSTLTRMSESVNADTDEKEAVGREGHASGRRLGGSEGGFADPAGRSV